MRFWSNVPCSEGSFRGSFHSDEITPAGGLHILKCSLWKYSILSPVLTEPRSEECPLFWPQGCVSAFCQQICWFHWAGKARYPEEASERASWVALGIWSGCLLATSMWRCFIHPYWKRPQGRPQTHLRDYISYLAWERYRFPEEVWMMCPGTMTTMLLCLACCHHDPALKKLWEIEGWMKILARNWLPVPLK